MLQHVWIDAIYTLYVQPADKKREEGRKRVWGDYNVVGPPL